MLDLTPPRHVSTLPTPAGRNAHIAAIPHWMVLAAHGKTGQYVFISSASVYEKPVRHYMMTERTKLENRYWQYSRDKIACEALLRDQDKLAYTIVRPSHTVRTHMPIQVGDPDAAIRRMIAGKGVIVAGDGSSLWTLTRSADVATPLVRLFGNSAALNDDFHITTDRGFTWRQIHEAIARGFGVGAPHLTRIAVQGGAAPGLSLATRRQSLAARLDRLGPARETAQIGAVRIRPVFSHSLWKRNCGQPGACPRSHAWRQPRHADQAALPSVAVAAAARRSTLPSGPRGTASTAHSRSGAL
jgi:hypothetical protein